MKRKHSLVHQLSLFDSPEYQRAEAHAEYDAASKESAVIWNAARIVAIKAYDLAIQQDGSTKAMATADGRYERAMQRADKIMAATMRQAHERLLARLRSLGIGA